MRKTREYLEPLSNREPKPEAKELDFCCPQCGNSGLSLMWTGVQLSREVQAIYEDGTVAFGPLIDDYETYDTFYACDWCGFRLRRGAGDYVETEEGLVKWIYENCKEPVCEVQ
jgi:predicted RNA-binding Zn-ribbon protein involved in translation (DUF1610 family)